jgi:tRNA nucleotidyltransferase/poly(A) polymerase
MNDIVCRLLDCVAEIWSTTYVVGGFLRERWFGLLSDDLDLIVPEYAISGSKKLASMLQVPWFILDAERDIARIILAEELTLDVARFATPDLHQDLYLRDISMNALICPLVPELFDLNVSFSDLPVIDLVAGLDDLSCGQIRGLRRENFSSDPVRLLRVFRFAAVYGFTVHSLTLQWIQELQNLLLNPASERLMREFNQLIVADFAVQALTVMRKLGLLQTFFAELTKENPAHIFRFEHIYAFAKQSDWIHAVFEPEQALKIQAYLSDFLSDTITRRHVLITAYFFCDQALENWKNFAKRMKLSKKETDFGVDIIRFSQEFKHVHALGRLQRFRIYRKYGESVPAAVLTLFNVTQKPLTSDCRLLVQEFFEPDHPLVSPPDLVSGYDLQTHLNLKPGPLLGRLLLSIQEAQAENKVSSRQGALDYVRQLLADQGQ